jgi:site-specific recombinase XerD
MTTSIAPFEDIANWERALYAFLAEKERRSGSRRTVEGYSRMLQHFFGSLGKPPDQVTSQEVFVYAHGVGSSGKEPSPVTIGARMASISSFYRFLIRMEIVSSNPCDQLERPKVSPSPPRGLSAEEIKRLLAVIPAKPSGLRDRAIILTLTLTGRRRSEVMNMKAGDISQSERLSYKYRGKGGKQAKRELPRPAFEAIERALAAWGKSLATMDPNESLWPTDDPDRAAAGLGITSGTFYGNLRRYFRKAALPPAGVHILRHAAAKLRRDVGESIEDVSRFLDHSSLAVTTVYLRRLEGQEDRSWGRVAEAIGV